MAHCMPIYCMRNEQINKQMRCIGCLRACMFIVHIHVIHDGVLQLQLQLHAIQNDVESIAILL